MAHSSNSPHNGTTRERPLGRRAFIAPAHGAPPSGRKRTPGPQFTAAFSLVEVTLALGLVSIAVLAVIGLLPGGLTTLRQSMNHTVETQIVQAIAAQSVVAPFPPLASPPLVRYFDDEGFPVAAASPRRRYTATVTPFSPLYPGSASAAGALASSLLNVRIQLEFESERKFFALQIANSGK